MYFTLMKAILSAGTDNNTVQHLVCPLFAWDNLVEIYLRMEINNVHRKENASIHILYTILLRRKEKKYQMWHDFRYWKWKEEEVGMQNS